MRVFVAIVARYISSKDQNQSTSGECGAIMTTHTVLLLLALAAAAAAGIKVFTLRYSITR